jgi:CRP/FNR family cyclic AMP-dependent transcriptional regulator
MLKNGSKKIFLLATEDEGRKNQVERLLNTRFDDSLIFYAADRTECMQKLKNVTPHVFITDFRLPKAPPGQMIDFVVTDDEYKMLPIIIMSPLPQKEGYLDEIVTGKVQFLEHPEKEDDLFYAVARALNFSAKSANTDFVVKFLKGGEVLMKEGDPAQAVYIVKKGTLKAYQMRNDQPVELGQINMGEFVGEMAYFNGEPRNATVMSVTDCELVEIPLGTFEKVLFQRPAWSKKVLETMSKRLKKMQTK